MNNIDYNSGQYPANRVIDPGLRLVRSLEMIGHGKRVLDIGCFDGSIAVEIMKAGNEVYGIDASRPAVDSAIEKGVHACVGDLNQCLPYDDKFFDVVFAGEIIEHVFDVSLLMSEMRRVLKPGGAAVITTPNLAALGRRLMLMLGMNPHIEIDLKKEGAAGHIRYFIKSTLRDLLEQHALKAVEWRSDVVNFNASGTICLKWLAKLFPTIGSTIIVKAVK